MTVSSTTKRVREIINDVREGKLIPKPAFQRRKVWSNKDKSFFIDTVLRDYPFPEIYWADGEVDIETGKGTTLIVDGQQRVTTLLEYFLGEETFRLSAEIPPYRDLSDDRKKKFLDYVVVVRHLGDLSNDKLIEVFSRINITSYSLNSMEINNAVYDGPLKKLAEEISQNPFFAEHNFFKPLQLKRMGDVRFILSVIISTMEGYFNRDEKFEEYLSRFNDTFPTEDSVRERILRTLSFISDCEFGPQSRVWQQSTIYCLIFELDKIFRSEGPQPTPDEAYRRLTNFFSSWSDVKELQKNEIAMMYDRANVQAANDRQNRVRRGRILYAILTGNQKVYTPPEKPIDTLPLFGSN